MSKETETKTPPQKICYTEFLSTHLKISFLEIQNKTAKLERQITCSYSKSWKEKVRALYKENKEYDHLLSYGPKNIASLATTTSVIRPKKEEEITEDELKNAIDAALFKVGMSMRRHAATLLRTQEHLVALADVTPRLVTLDNRKVVNPVGFTARTLEISFEEVLLPKETLKDIFSIIPRKKILKIQSRAATALRTVSKEQSSDNFHLLYIGEEESVLAKVENNNWSEQEHINWGVNALKNRLTRELGLTKKEAAAVYNRYKTNKLSKSMKSFLEDLFKDEALFLFHATTSRTKKDPMKSLVVVQEQELPEVCLEKKLLKKLELPKSLHITSVDIISQKNGFTVQLSESRAPKNERFETLELGLMAYFQKPERVILPVISKRRKKWLNA